MERAREHKESTNVANRARAGRESREMSGTAFSWLATALDTSGKTGIAGRNQGVGGRRTVLKRPWPDERRGLKSREVQAGCWEQTIPLIIRESVRQTGRLLRPWE